MKQIIQAITNFFRAFSKSAGERKKQIVTGGVIASVATSITLALPMVKEHEGLRVKAYLDPVGIPTICFGETLGVRMGDQKSPQECEDMLVPRLEGFLNQMRACTRLPGGIPMPPRMEAAFLSFTYNLGPGVYCSNMAVKRLNKGKYTEACNAILLYNKAGGQVLRGLERRRKEEHEMCVQGMREGNLRG